MSQEDKIQKRISLWKNFDSSIRQEIENLEKNNPLELQDRFAKNLVFGTAGARAVMGVGTNRFNIYTIKLLTYAVTEYLLKTKKGPLSVVIGYDVRNNSKLFAEEAAKVLAAYNIQVYLYSEVVTIGLMSLGIRLKKASLGIMITASHNSKEYNGFKVYDFHGGQILNDVASLISAELIEDERLIKTVPLMSKHIHYFYEEVKKTFIRYLKPFALLDKQNQKEGKNLSIVYTNLHGGGITLMPDALHSWGFDHVLLVEEQKEMNGNFPSAPSPNPEDNSALKLGIEKLLKEKGDILIATDPDGDRLGVVVRHKNEAIRLTGNQVAELLFYHIASEKRKMKTIPSNAAIVKSIVTTPCLDKMAEHFNIRSFHTLTGFKYASELIDKWDVSQEYQFLLGAEESCGYLCVDFVRDKEAISAACYIAEMALKLKKQNKTCVDALEDLYLQLGVYKEKTISVALTEQNKKNLTKLRNQPPEKVAGLKVVEITDYEKQISTNLITNHKSKIFLPQSDVMELVLEDGSRFLMRPSGTEPKMKSYLFIKEEIKNRPLKEVEKIADQKLLNLESAILKMFKN